MTTSNEHNNAPAVPQGWTDDQVISFASMILLQGNRDDSIEVRLQKFREHEKLRGNATPAPAPAQDEPLGHFRVEPFGWTDCAATDDGAIALYERPQEVGLTDEALDNLIEDLSEWSRHVVEDTAHQTLEAHVREVLEKNPIIAALRAKGQS